MISGQEEQLIQSWVSYYLSVTAVCPRKQVERYSETPARAHCSTLLLLANYSASEIIEKVRHGERIRE